MMNVKLKEAALKRLLSLIEPHQYIFKCDGCDCGDFVYELGNNISIWAYRSCRKAGSTPDNQFWHLHDLKLIKTDGYIMDYDGLSQEVDDEFFYWKANINHEQKNIIEERLLKVCYQELGEMHMNIYLK